MERAPKKKKKKITKGPFYVHSPLVTETTDGKGLAVMAANRSAVRTSSVSSGTASEQGTKKKFACDFPNCGKSFSRSEHLHRHALNHRDGNNTCKRCSAHFRRRDLLGMPDTNPAI